MIDWRYFPTITRMIWKPQLGAMYVDLLYSYIEFLVQLIWTISHPYNYCYLIDGPYSVTCKNVIAWQHFTTMDMMVVYFMLPLLLQ